MLEYTSYCGLWDLKFEHGQWPSFLLLIEMIENVKNAYVICDNNTVVLLQKRFMRTQLTIFYTLLL